MMISYFFFFFFSSRRRHTRFSRDWSSDVCSSDLLSVPRAAERDRLRAELGLRESDVVGIWVGSLDERRDPVAVVHAAERTATPLLIVGDGPLRAEVERAAKEHVHVLGHRNDVPPLLDAADFFVLMSQREGLSFALLEAMAHGLPAIVADVPENVEAVGDSGLAVRYGDEEDIVVALRHLVHDREARAVLAARARERVAEHFAVEDMIDGTRSLYDEVEALGGLVPREQTPRGE